MPGGGTILPIYTYILTEGEINPTPSPPSPHGLLTFNFCSSRTSSHWARGQAGLTREQIRGEREGNNALNKNCTIRPDRITTSPSQRWSPTFSLFSVSVLKTGASGMIAYRLLCKDLSFQYLQTSSRLVYKNSKPDFIVSTHRPLTWVQPSWERPHRHIPHISVF